MADVAIEKMRASLELAHKRLSTAKQRAVSIDDDDKRQEVLDAIDCALADVVHGMDELLAE